ncbi:hypothetical protein PR048_007118 [Dryococelus australis]|uniref:Secreted protein n=1 Tax=Dryococelus australis TaxID=614101 RepID=A0ABQ9ICS6_9NEOP|nr:hypothetical protein PR048_007118 [Dryococelus australis]
MEGTIRATPTPVLLTLACSATVVALLELNYGTLGGYKAWRTGVGTQLGHRANHWPLAASRRPLHHVPLPPSTLPSITPETAVAERLARSPPTKANRVQSPAGSLLDFCRWESCRTLLLVGGFSRGSPVSPALSFRRRYVLTSITPPPVARFSLI